MLLRDFRFERPERRVVTETVQPPRSSSTALNETLHNRRDQTYQSLAQRVGLKPWNTVSLYIDTFSL